MRTRKVIQTQLVFHSAALAFIWIAFLIRNTQNKVSLEKRKLLSDGQHEKCWVLNDGGWDCEMDELRGTCSALLRFEGCLRGVTFHSSRLRWWRMLGGNWNEWRKSKAFAAKGCAAVKEVLRDFTTSSSIDSVTCNQPREREKLNELKSCFAAKILIWKLIWKHQSETFCLFALRFNERKNWYFIMESQMTVRRGAFREWNFNWILNRIESKVIKLNLPAHRETPPLGEQ